MTQFPHDQFAKEYLKELLSPLGQVETGFEIVSEVRSVDVFFIPISAAPEYVERLGLLGNLASTAALFEPYRNPVSWDDIRKCQGKLIDVLNDWERKAKREGRKISERELPMLWILTPTASSGVLEAFACQVMEGEKGMPGVYRFPQGNRTGMVVIHQLPEVEETLWLRMLGRGKVQERAISQLAALPVNDPLRTNGLELVYSLQAQLQARLQERQEELDAEDRKLIMTVGTLFREQLDAAVERGIEQGIERGRTEGIEEGIERGIEQGIERGRTEGIEEGIERGRIEGQRSILENFLQVRLGEIDPILTLFLTPVATLPAAEFAMLLVRLSMLSVEEHVVEQARELLAQTLLRSRFPDGDDRLTPRFLGLSQEELITWLSRWGEVTNQELLGLLEGDEVREVDSPPTDN
jgi:flagellar biosynthesis/type III secretory pathway protein FliH